jgi:hypothetical protein
VLESFVVGVAGFEPTTFCSQSRRDTGLRYTPKKMSSIQNNRCVAFGASTFPFPQRNGTRYRATLHPEKNTGGEGGIRTPGKGYPLRQFSKLLVSATHPPLQTADLFFWRRQMYQTSYVFCKSFLLYSKKKSFFLLTAYFTGGLSLAKALTLR